MRTWARQLRKLHQADETQKSGEGIGSLSAAPLRAAGIRELGGKLELYSALGGGVRSGQAELHSGTPQH